QNESALFRDVLDTLRPESVQPLERLRDDAGEHVEGPRPHVAKYHRLALLPRGRGIACDASKRPCGLRPHGRLTHNPWRAAVPKDPAKGRYGDPDGKDARHRRKALRRP